MKKLVEIAHIKEQTWVPHLTNIFKKEDEQVLSKITDTDVTNDSKK